MKANRQGLELLNCATGGAVLCAKHIAHETYPNVAQLSLIHGRPMCVPIRDQYARSDADLGGKRKKTEETGSPSSLNLINDVAISKYDVTRNEDGASAVLS